MDTTKAIERDSESETGFRSVIWKGEEDHGVVDWWDRAEMWLEGRREM